MKFTRQYISIALGVVSAAFGMESFLLPNSFIDGGITGISLLLDKITPPFWSLQFFLVILNIPFIILALRQIGKGFALRTLFAILALALVLTFIDFPLVTKDKLLASVFGGFFLGAGIGLAIRGGGVLDGTEVFAVYVSRNISLSVSDVIMLINVVIFLVAAMILSVESALYSILTYLIASKTIDFIINGIEEYTEVTIITASPVEVRNMITEKLGWGVTIYSGKSGYNLKELEILSTIITRLEIAKLKSEVSSIDVEAFIITQSIKDIRGGMVKKRPLH
ncbi:YitT family protein [Bacteroidetes bacterium endosymbiont of Geopemphigus sp.]|uniref:YitT family protein n=1 Tax=Bacteroidetes bacterium endosymbiont of Geopemphigus sp. TaxID=2047937 RepID=UPI001F4E9714|nr:YitT family protein [Bacteroidetes bacterium endosymbiont of Geopemphigus sp.]